MAYTYDDFATAATQAGMLEKFSAEDLQVTKNNPEYGLSLLSLMRDEANATTNEQRLLAQEAANQLRKNYSAIQNSSGTLNFTNPYSGQISSALDKLTNYGDFQYADEDRYQKLLASLSGENGIDYDYTQDPTWSAYKKAYLREGDRATRDTLAKASAATGGRPSSYAVSAAAQAGNNYAAELTDMIPTLYQQELTRRMNALGALESDRNYQYQNWQNGYNMLQNDLNNYMQQGSSEYAQFLQRYSDALALYQTLGYATPEVAAILGVEEGKPKTKVIYREPDEGDGDDPTLVATGNLSADKIKLIQWQLGVERTGIWDEATMRASGQTDSNEAYKIWEKGGFGTETATYHRNGQALANKIKNLSNSEKLNEIKKAYETEKIDYEMLKELLSTFKLT